jgi:hypothetical protein
MSNEAETTVATAAKRPATEYTNVEMADGRKVVFAGKRKVNKETLIDESKIAIDEASGIVQFSAGAVAVRMDFRNGKTRTFPLPLTLMAQFMGHGAEQKYGDELASPADKPLSEDDMVIAVEDLDTEIQKGNWGKGRASGGGGVSGASIVVQAIMEATGKDQATVKAYLDKKIASTEGLTRQALYASFRVPGTKTGAIIARLEAEKAAKTSKVDADAELASV